MLRGHASAGLASALTRRASVFRTRCAARCTPPCGRAPNGPACWRRGAASRWRAGFGAAPTCRPRRWSGGGRGAPSVPSRCPSACASLWARWAACSRPAGCCTKGRGRPAGTALLGTPASRPSAAAVPCRPPARPQLLSVRVKDAVCDAIRDARGTKPLPPEPGRAADLPLYCTAYHDRLSIYRDMSGTSLHRHGRVAATCHCHCQPAGWQLGCISHCLHSVACPWTHVGRGSPDSGTGEGPMRPRAAAGCSKASVLPDAHLQARLPAGHAPRLAERGRCCGHPPAGWLAPGLPPGGRRCGGALAGRCHCRVGCSLAAMQQRVTSSPGRAAHASRLLPDVDSSAPAC